LSHYTNNQRVETVQETAPYILEGVMKDSFSPEENNDNKRATEIATQKKNICTNQ